MSQLQRSQLDKDGDGSVSMDEMKAGFGRAGQYGDTNK
jgi:hypothetical protein